MKTFYVGPSTVNMHLDDREAVDKARERCSEASHWMQGKTLIRICYPCLVDLVKGVRTMTTKIQMSSEIVQEVYQTCGSLHKLTHSICLSCATKAVIEGKRQIAAFYEEEKKHDQDHSDRREDGGGEDDSSPRTDSQDQPCELRISLPAGAPISVTGLPDKTYCVEVLGSRLYITEGQVFDPNPLSRYLGKETPPENRGEDEGDPS